MGAYALLYVLRKLRAEESKQIEEKKVTKKKEEEGGTWDYGDSQGRASWGGSKLTT